MAQRAVLGAAHAARGDAEHARGLARGVRRFGAEAEAQLEHAALEPAEAGQDGARGPRACATTAADSSGVGPSSASR